MPSTVWLDGLRIDILLTEEETGGVSTVFIDHPREGWVLAGAEPHRFM